MQSNVRQTLVMRNQAGMTVDLRNRIWKEIIIRKIENQARALTLLGMDGAEKRFYGLHRQSRRKGSIPSKHVPQGNTFIIFIPV